MSLKTKVASAMSVAATFMLLFFSADESRALAGELISPPTPIAGVAVQIDAAHGDIDPAQSDSSADPSAQTDAAQAQTPEPIDADTLAELVEKLPSDIPLSEELGCLAAAIYFEARGEPLAGQLAVGEVVANRADSGRFPRSYCGVVHQRAQFSFLRDGRMPKIDKRSPAWRRASAIARIVDEDLWESPANGALFFHATHVRPGWRLQRVAQLSSHIFYR